MKKILLSLLAVASLGIANAQTTLTLGDGTSSSATRGPFQRSGPNSTTGIVSSSVFSVGQLVYIADELTDLGSASTITQINFDLGSSNVITATGDAIMEIYMKNSTITSANADGTLLADAFVGATLVGTYTFNTTNNFPGAEGFMDFILDTQFDYTGGTLEILVDWDSSGLTGLDETNFPNVDFSGNGSLNWHWTATTHSSFNYRASSSAPSEFDNLKAQRVNTQIIYTDIVLSNNDFTINGESITAYQPTSGTIAINGVEVDAANVYALNGSVVAKGAQTVDVSTLATGVYILQVESNGKSTAKTIVVQ